MGEYLHLQAGIVYRAFSRDEHVTDLQLERSVPLLWSLDFNYNPMSSVVAQKVRGKIHVLDEIVMKNATTEEACEAFCERYPNPRAGVVVYGDCFGLRASHQRANGLRHCQRDTAASAEFAPSTGRRNTIRRFGHG